MEIRNDELDKLFRAVDRAMRYAKIIREGTVIPKVEAGNYRKTALNLVCALEDANATLDILAYRDMQTMPTIPPAETPAPSPPYDPNFVPEENDWVVAQVLSVPSKSKSN